MKESETVVEHASQVIKNWFVDGFRQATGEGERFERRVGAELKFPLVREDGNAAPPEAVDALWRFLTAQGWQPSHDATAGRVVGAKTRGEQNDTVASCETGYCKVEFSLAHVGNLHALAQSLQDLRALLQPFMESESVRFLGYGMQPITPPSKALLMKKERASVWDKACPSNRQIPPTEGDDVHLFTVNAGSHVHVSVRMEEAIAAVNVLNGFAPAQIALMANSSIWKGQEHLEYKCVAEKLWDWWAPAAGRSGMPAAPFADIDDYVKTVASFRPIYVRREGGPIILKDYRSFADYFAAVTATGYDLQGRKVSFVPTPEDVDLHNSCYWYNARVSRYYTVENRACDQQPPDALICIAALTLGLMSALSEAWDELRTYAWSDLRAARDAACRSGLDGRHGDIGLRDLSRRMLDIARLGLQRRGLGEEDYLAPLRSRIEKAQSPADEAATLFRTGGARALVEARTL